MRCLNKITKSALAFSMVFSLTAALMPAPVLAAEDISIDEEMEDTLLGDETKVTITFDATLATLDDDQLTKEVIAGKIYGQMPEPYMNGYYFKGWFTDPNGGEEVGYYSVVPDNLESNAQTLYAHWGRDEDPAINGKNQVISTSLTLSGKIGVNFYLSFTEQIARDENAYVVLSFNGIDTKEYIKDHFYATEDPIDPSAQNYGRDVYKFTFPVSAKNISDAITLKVYDRDGQQQALVNSYGYGFSDNTLSYSVAKYAAAVAELETTSENANLKELCKALTNYGAYAQIYFDHNASSAAVDAAAIASVDAACVGHAKSINTSTTEDSTIKYVGSSLVLNSGTEVRHYFALDQGLGLSDFKFLVDKGQGFTETELLVHSDGNMYYLPINDIAAQRLGSAHVVKITDKAEEPNALFEMSYSAMSYVNGRLDSNSSTEDSLSNLARALYNYYRAAQTYFNVSDESAEGSGVTPSSTDNRFDETNLVIVNGSGAILKGWQNANNGHRYYSDQTTGKVVTGFNYINGKMYYFGQKATDVGQLMTGFFNVAADSERRYGKDFYDDTYGASNRYYAYKDGSRIGEIHTSGWDIMTAQQMPAGSQTYNNEQVWSYCFASNMPSADKIANADSYDASGNKSADNIVVKEHAAEVVSGNAFISKADNSVVPVKSLTSDHSDPDDFAALASKGVPATYTADNYYRFNSETGARARSVMYFYGNYYGAGKGNTWNPPDGGLRWSYLDANQQNMMHTEARWINSDTRFATIASDFHFINGEEWKSTWDDFGNFPMTGSSYVGNPGKADSRDDESYMYNLTNNRLSGTLYSSATKYWQQDIAGGYDSVTGTFVGRTVDGAAKSPATLIYNQSTDRFDVSGDETAMDGNVDVYDTMYYSYEAYKAYLSKYGQNNLVLMGASSGAGICVSVLLLAKDHGIAQPARTLLFCPWLDVNMTGNPANYSYSGTDNATLKYWGARYTRDGDYIPSGEAASAYVGCKGPGMKYWMASPVYYGGYDGAITGLDNITMYAGNLDPCLSGANKFKSKLQGATNVNVYSYPNYGHGFMFSDSQYTSTVMRDAAAKVMIE